MIVLDTTVLVYAKGAGHPFRDPCRELIEAVSDGLIEATTTVEVIQEFVHVRARRRGRGDAAALGAAYAELLAPLISVNRETLDRGLEMFVTPGSPGAFDCVLASAALSAGADALVSADVAFGEVAGPRHVIPDRPGIAALLDSV